MQSEAISMHSIGVTKPCGPSEKLTSSEIKCTQMLSSEIKCSHLQIVPKVDCEVTRVLRRRNDRMMPSLMTEAISMQLEAISMQLEAISMHSFRQHDAIPDDGGKLSRTQSHSAALSRTQSQSASLSRHPSQSEPI